MCIRDSGWWDLDQVDLTAAAMFDDGIAVVGAHVAHPVAGLSLIHISEPTRPY